MLRHAYSLKNFNTVIHHVTITQVKIQTFPSPQTILYSSPF